MERMVFIRQAENIKFAILTASGDRRHDGNTITVLHRGGFFLQIAHIFVVEINIDKGAEFALVSVKMATEIRMLRDQAGQGVANASRLDLHGRLLAGILAQRSRDVNLGHV